MFIFLAIFVIVVNFIFIYSAAQNNSKYGTKKLIMALVSIVMWVISMTVVYVGLNGNITMRLISFSHCFEAFVAPVSAMALYEFANMKKIKNHVFFLVCLLPIVVGIITYFPAFNYIGMYYVDGLPVNLISSYRYTNFFIIYEAYSYLSGVLCIYWFYKIEKRAYNKNNKKLKYIFTPIVIGTVVNFITLHGYINVNINYAPIIYSLSYFVLFFILSIYNFSAYRNLIVRSIVDKSDSLILAFDKKGNLIFANNEIKKACNFPEDIIGKNILDKNFFLKYLSENFYEEIYIENKLVLTKSKLDKTKYYKEEEKFFEINGKKYKKTIIEIYVSKKLIKIFKFMDMTLEIEKTEEIKKFSYNDSLTKLGNRFAFEKDIKLLENKENIGLLTIDIDNLKSTNDILGHDVGDKILIKFAELIKSVFKDTQIGMYRLGGDEFCIICKVESKEKLELQIKKLFKEASKEDGSSIQVSFSVGCALKTNNITMLDLYKFSDASMYKSKKDGKNQWTFFSNEIHESMILYDNLKEDFIVGLLNNEIIVYFQGKYNMEKKGIYGAEALVRWNHKKLGLLEPRKFLHIASTLKLLSEIDFIVLEKSCEYQNLWKKKYNIELEISVNISIESLIKPSLFYDISKILNKYDVNPETITLEILENKLINDFVFARKIIKKLKELGLKFSIDDFGSGFSNFDRINGLHADYIKIDKSLIDDIAFNNDSKECVRLMCELIKNLGCGIIIEGVETKEQVEILKQFDIDYIQGYYFCKPISTEKFEEEFLINI